MRKAVLFLTVALTGLTPALFTPAQAADTPVSTSASGFTDAQRAEIESIIKQYIVSEHPEVLAEAMQTLQQREQDNAQVKTKAEVNNAKDKIYDDPNSPVVGNTKGDVTIVEFFDYQCGYCKMSEDGLEKVVKDDKNIKLIYKDFPILGAVSTEAAKASLASVKQGKFQAFHDALMSKKDHITSDTIYSTAKDVGLDVEKLKKDMAQPGITDMISDNMKLGQQIGVRGTPMFIINDNIYPGALQYDQLKQAVTDARGAEKKS